MQTQPLLRRRARLEVETDLPDGARGFAKG